MSIVLENDYIRVSLNEATGGALSLLNKRRNTELVATPSTSPLFRLIAPKDDLLCHLLDPGVAIASTTDGKAVFTFDWPHLFATMQVELSGPAILASLRIENRSSLTIEEVQFPSVTGLGPIPGGMLTLPNFGRRRLDPFGPDLSGDRRHAEQYLAKLTARYPERMVTAWCDYASAEHGIALEARHTDFRMIDFMVAKTVNKKASPFTRTLDITAAHPYRIAPGEWWESPPMRLLLHEGDWHTVADEHREWAETWLPRRVPTRTFADSVGWHYFFLKHQDGSHRFTYADIPRMAKAALDAGCPYLLLFGWHAPGHDNHYCYRYVPSDAWGGIEALRAGIEQARAMGARVIPFFNGTLANVNAPEHRAFGHRWEARTREDAPYHAGDWAGFTVDVPTTSRGRMHHELCPTPEHQQFFLETLRRIVADYAFGNIQLDQIAIKMMPCYNVDHRHDQPARAFTDGIASILRETRAFLDAAYPDGMILSECTNEFTGQWCDGAWTWEFVEDTEPILYACPWLLTSTCVDAMEFAETNRAFVHKIMLDMRIGGGDELIAEYPAYSEHVRKLSALKRRTRKYYADACFRDLEGLADLNAQGEGRTVAKVFSNRIEKTSGIAVAETAGSPVQVDLRWNLSGVEGAKLESSTGISKNLEISDGRVTLHLDAYEVALLCIDNA
ncbi:MAG: hypothetical protein K1Y02_24765 [Candidatus Hydrogenedentes bacterium]|nr:hypothetical protein [Candidatus Hydrogenedentota bacterium]